MMPIIGITTFDLPNPPTGTVRAAVNDTYIKAVAAAGGLPVLIPPTTDSESLDQYVAACHGFVFSGGIDVSPSCYGENPHPMLGETSLKLDRYQIPLMEKVLAAKKPVLAICRGCQVLNVACGGTLYQDNSLHGEIMKHVQATMRGDYSHQVSVEPGTVLHSMFGDRVWTNSYHHQSVKDLGKGLVISARAEDGIVEAIELKDYPYGMGIQWHPEAMLEVEDSMKPLFAGLLEAVSNS